VKVQVNRRAFLHFAATVCSTALFSASLLAQSPTVSGISPANGVVGMQVQISGSGFGASQGSSTVTLGGTVATITGWSDASISAVVPAGASTGAFSVTVAGQTAYSPTFTVASLPSGWADADVGTVGQVGSASYANGVFTVQGAGTGRS